jgi:hypothetical protein
VRNQQKLIDLPDFSAWQVETRVHESRIQQIKMGMPAMITIDAFGGKSVKAQVAKIGVLPDSSRWFMPDTKEYLVNLDLTTTTLGLKPGMTTQTEILFQTLKNALFVPIQSVATRDGRTSVWRKGELGPRVQEVEVGPNNDRFVEIRSGLKEGDVIFMQAQEAGGGSGVVKRPSDGKPEEKEEKAGNGAPAGEENKDRGARKPRRERPVQERPAAVEGKVNSAAQETSGTLGRSKVAQEAVS